MATITLAAFDGVTLTATVYPDGTVDEFVVRGGAEGAWSYCHGDLNGAVKRYAADAGLPWTVAWQ